MTVYMSMFLYGTMLEFNPSLGTYTMYYQGETHIVPSNEAVNLIQYKGARKWREFKWDL